MLRLANTKTVILAIVAVIVVGSLFRGGGFALIVPVAAIFWLDGLARALGFTVSINGGVDAFNLVPPNALGMLLILAGSAASLGAACLMVRRLVQASPPDPLRSNDRWGSR